MGQPTRRKKFHRGDTRASKDNKGKKRSRDLDQIYEDLQPQMAKKLRAEQPIDHELPGCGQFYCVQCARYFVDASTLQLHERSKAHKQRVKDLKTVPFSQKEAEAAAGMGSYFNPQNLIKDNVVVENQMAIMSITSPLSEQDSLG